MDSSIVTPPTGSALEVDANNSPTPTAGVPGVTAIVNYIASAPGGGGLTTIEQTTGQRRLRRLRRDPVDLRHHRNPRNRRLRHPRGALPKFPTKEVTIAPNYTTHYPVVYDRGRRHQG